MQLHQIQRIHANRRSVQVGRGGKRGKTSGRGGKGQTARAGHKVRPEIRDAIMKIPKRRGFAFKSFVPKPATVNLAVIERTFSSGETVSPGSLLSKGLIETYKGVVPKVKILSDGELSKPVTIAGCAVSGSAKRKIEAAGGSVSFAS